MVDKVIEDLPVSEKDDNNSECEVMAEELDTEEDSSRLEISDAAGLMLEENSVQEETMLELGSCKEMLGKDWNPQNDEAIDEAESAGAMNELIVEETSSTVELNMFEVLVLDFSCCPLDCVEKLYVESESLTAAEEDSQADDVDVIVDKVSKEVTE